MHSSDREGDECIVNTFMLSMHVHLEGSHVIYWFSRVNCELVAHAYCTSIEHTIWLSKYIAGFTKCFIVVILHLPQYNPENYQPYAVVANASLRTPVTKIVMCNKVE